jgi:hypothetical protein
MKIPSEYLMRYLNDINLYTPVLIQGYNADVDSAAWEDLTSVGATYISPGDSHIHLDSSSAEDDPAEATPPGTGAHEIKIFYIDTDGHAHSETMTMTGTTTSAASTATNVNFINGAYVVTAGTGKSAAGTILIRNAADGATLGQIGVGESQAFLGIYKVPTGYALDIISMKFSSVILATGAISLSYYRLLVENWNKIAGTLVSTNSEHYFGAVSGSEPAVDLMSPLRIPAGSVVRLQAKGAADNNMVTGYVEGFLYKTLTL